MAFIQTITDVHQYVSERGYEIANHDPELIRFNTSHLSIAYVRNRLEHTHSLYIGAKNSITVVEIFDKTISECFPQSCYELQQDLPKFLDVAIQYLEADSNRIKALDAYFHKRNAAYTTNLLQQQKYNGQSLEERIRLSGLSAEYDNAVKSKNKQVLRHILRQVNYDDESIEQIIAEVIQ